MEAIGVLYVILINQWQREFHLGDDEDASRQPSDPRMKAHLQVLISREHLKLEKDGQVEVDDDGNGYQ